MTEKKTPLEHLENLYEEYGDFEVYDLSSHTLSGWSKFSGLSEEEKKKVDVRQVLTPEIVLDADNVSFEEVVKRLEQDSYTFKAYKHRENDTGHIHLFFPELSSLDKEKRKEAKEEFIAKFGCDISKQKERNMIALEYSPHYKTKKVKKMVKERNNGENELPKTILKKIEEPKIHDIKKKVSLKGVAENYGVDVKEKGNSLCPFHDDTNPSLSIDTTESVGVWYCHGCGKGGTVIDFVMEAEGCTEREAIKMLKERLGFKISPSLKSSKKNLDEEIHSLEEIEKKEERTERAKKILKELSYFEEVEYEPYLDDLKDASGIGKRVLRRTIKNFKKERAEAEAEATSSKAGKYIPKPEKEVKISELKGVIERNFKHLWFPTKVAISVLNTLLIKDVKDPAGVNFVTVASGGKTTVLSFFYDIEGVTYKSDDFTPASFVSHSANTQEHEWAEIDLLPRIRYKGFIVPELAPILGKRKEDLQENLSTLTRVFDGEGYWKDTGVAGGRGYKGDYLFAWLGATTPLSYRVWDVMGKLGSRLFFYEFQETEESDKELEDMMDSNYKKMVDECKDYVEDYMLTQWDKWSGVRGVEWDKDKDSQEARQILVACSRLIARLRATVQTWKTNNDQGDKMYEYKKPQVEKPFRIMNVLYNITRGRALAHGRDYILPEDCDVAVELVFGTMPEDRRKIFRAIVESGGTLTSKQLAKEMDCSKQHARRMMEFMTILGVGERIQAENNSKPLRLKPEIEKYVRNIITHAHSVESGFEPVSEEKQAEHETDTVRVRAEKNNKIMSASDFKKEIIGFIKPRGEAEVEDMINTIGEDYRKDIDRYVEKMKTDGELYEIQPGKLKVIE